MNNINQFVALLLILLFSSCSVPKRTINAYKPVEKPAQSYTVTYQMPKVKAAPQTIQKQRKGGVTLSIEIEPFSVLKKMRTGEEKVVATDNPAFDKFEIAQIPYYDISPQYIRFKLRVRNDQSRILRLSDALLAIEINNAQMRIDQQSEDWMSGYVRAGTEREFVINGPKLSELTDKKALMGIFIDDMPTSYDGAGNITQKSNFEWYFDLHQEQKSSTDQITYKYERRPVYKELCSVCGADGYHIVKCTNCAGTGKVRNKKGQIIKHYLCEGTGKLKKDCATCVAGKIAHRKSGDPEVEASWDVYTIKVHTIPVGARIGGYDPDTNSEKFVNSRSNTKIGWMPRANNGVVDEPIIVEYDNQQVRVLPHDENGEIIGKIEIDFTGDEPVVIKGKRVDKWSNQKKEPVLAKKDQETKDNSTSPTQSKLISQSIVNDEPQNKETDDLNRSQSNSISKAPRPRKLSDPKPEQVNDKATTSQRSNNTPQANSESSELAQLRQQLAEQSKLLEEMRQELDEERSKNQKITIAETSTPSDPPAMSQKVEVPTQQATIITKNYRIQLAAGSSSMKFPTVAHLGQIVTEPVP